MSTILTPVDLIADATLQGGIVMVRGDLAAKNGLLSLSQPGTYQPAITIENISALPPDELKVILLKCTFLQRCPVTIEGEVTGAGAFVSIQMRRIVSPTSTDPGETPAVLIGTWCDNSPRGDSEAVIQLTLFTDSAGALTGEFFSGGPFQESYSTRLSDSGELLLFFKDVLGSISFNRMQDQEGWSKCRKDAVARGHLRDRNTLVMQLTPNQCSYLPAAAEVVLRRLDESESCWRSTPASMPLAIFRNSRSYSAR